MKDELIPFDDTTRCHDRRFDEIWMPYAFAEDREERDRIYGPTPDHMLLDEICGPEYVIPRRHFYKAYNAVCFANFLGVTLSSMISINWEKCGWEDPKVIDKEYNRFAARLRKFFTDKGYPPFYLTVFENAPKVGLHSHTLVPVPHELKEKMKRWVRLAIQPRDPYAVREAACYRFDVEAGHNIVAQWNRFRYLMKNLDDAVTPAELKQHGDKTASKLYGVGYWPHKQSGTVTIKRIRVARALDMKAQQLLRYRPAQDITDNIHPLPDRYSDAELKRGKEWRRGQEIADALSNMQILLS